MKHSAHKRRAILFKERQREVAALKQQKKAAAQARTPQGTPAQRTPAQRSTPALCARAYASTLTLAVTPPAEPVPPIPAPTPQAGPVAPTPAPSTTSTSAGQLDNRSSSAVEVEEPTEEREDNDGDVGGGRNSRLPPWDEDEGEDDHEEDGGQHGPHSDTIAGDLLGGMAAGRPALENSQYRGLGSSCGKMLESHNADGTEPRAWLLSFLMPSPDTQVKPTHGNTHASNTRNQYSGGSASDSIY